MLEPWVTLIIMAGGLVVLMVLGLPVAFSFMLINIVGAWLFWGGQSGLEELALSMCKSISVFTLLPLPMFILMGEVMSHSGVATMMIDALNKWFGRLPGRLSLLAVAAGVLLATLTGVTMSSVAMMGSVLVPEMEKHGYKKMMSLGPILGSGGLAIMIPPSGLAILVGALGEISIGKILVAIIIPGLLLAVLFAAYIMIRCWFQPSLAPAYEAPSVSLFEKLASIVRLLPAGFLIFLVVGLVFLGVATPTEAAALGAVGSLIIAAGMKQLKREVIRKSFGGALQIMVMVLVIMMGSLAYSQIMAFTGATRWVGGLAIHFALTPLAVMIAMQVVLLIMGCFLDQISIMMVTIPIFMPVVRTFGMDPVWFAAIYLLNMEMAAITPPFGLELFTMKGVAPPDTTMGDIITAALPFVCLDLVGMALMIAFPIISLWLPGLMH